MPRMSDLSVSDSWWVTSVGEGDYPTLEEAAASMAHMESYSAEHAAELRVRILERLQDLAGRGYIVQRDGCWVRVDDAR